MYSVRNNNPLYKLNFGETNSALISTSYLPSSNDSSSHKTKKLSDQPPKISNKSKTIDPDTDCSSYVPEKSLLNQNPSDDFFIKLTTMRTATAAITTSSQMKKATTKLNSLWVTLMQLEKELKKCS